MNGQRKKLNAETEKGLQRRMCLFTLQELCHIHQNVNYYSTLSIDVCRTTPHTTAQPEVVFHTIRHLLPKVIHPVCQHLPFCFLSLPGLYI